MIAHPKSTNIINFLTLIYFTSLILLISSLSTKDFPNFDSYCQKFNKSYENAQYQQRRLIYNQNIQNIVNSNCKAKGVNFWTDATPQQMAQLKGAFEANVPKLSVTQQQQFQSIMTSGLTLTDKAPLNYDWRDFNAVTPVKYQKSCGSCWAFSTTAFFQSDLIISNNYTNSIDLSEQFLLKCDNRSLKCDGGFLFWAMNRIIDQHSGMPTQNQYPYDYSRIYSQDGMCYQTDLIRVDKNKKMVSYFDVEDPRFIEKMILKKPVNVNLCSKDLQFYSPTSTSRTLVCDPVNSKRDHTVLLVGYTQTEWIIKNQWSDAWGVEGYGYITKDRNNDCCIGKQLYTTGVISQKCSVQNCSICVEETSCYQCKPGYYVYSSLGKHICRKCGQSNCQRCLNFFGLCDVCRPGYSVTYPYYKCEPSTVENCSFMHSGSCAQCHEGYMLSSKGLCVSEKQVCYVDGCDVCKQNKQTACSKCSTGFLLNNFTLLCDKLPKCNIQNCSQCAFDDANKCEVCLDKDFAFSQKELKCVLKCQIQGCLSCSLIKNDSNEIKQCGQCRSGYQLSVDKLSCQKCQIKYCADCSADTNSCISCMNGFYFNKTLQKCSPCSDLVGNCAQCNIDIKTDKLICSKCNNGFSVSQNLTSCIRCLSECMTTSYQTLNVCSPSCGPMNYFDQDVCKKCSQNCESCSSNLACSKCLQGFILQNGTCYKKCNQDSKCLKCSFGLSQSVCVSCRSGYKLQYGVCQFDPSYKCLQENGQNPQGCVSCPQGYYLNSNYPRKVCSKCQSTDLNCIGCLSNAPQNCSKCSRFYYLQKTNLSCVKCSSFDLNCLECFTNNFCSQCKAGFYLLSSVQNDQSSGLCYPCNPSCLTCKYNSQFCTSCAEGYELTLGKKCLKNVKIRFSIVLDADYDTLLNEFIMQIYDGLRQLFGLETSKQIEIFKVQKGSIKVTGDFHMSDDLTDSNAFLQRTRQILINKSKVGQYTILSSEADLVRQPIIQKDDENNGLPIGILIGIAVGGGVFVLIVIGILIWVIRRYACKKGSQDNEQQQVKADSKRQNHISQKSSKTAKTTNPKSQYGTNQTHQIGDTNKYLSNDQPEYLRDQRI